MNNSSLLGRRDFLCAGIAGAAGTALDASPQGQPGTKVRYGVVGSGNRAVGNHLPLLKRCVPEVEVVALCDITPAALERGHALCPSAATYSDHRRMLAEHPEIDAVLVVIPNYMHAQVTVDALEAGKHVLVEKPMTTRLADADRMIAAARKHNRALQVGIQCRYNETFDHMEKLIKDGAIGDVEYVFGSLFRGDWNPRSWQYTDPVTGKKANWRFLTKTAGTSLMEDAIEELDLVNRLVGAKPKRIQAQGGNNVWKGRETIDHAGVLVEYANGAKFNFAYTLFTPISGNHEVFRVFGSKAEMSFDEQWYSNRGEGEILVQPYGKAKAQRVRFSYLRPEEASWDNGRPFDIGTAREHKAFVNSIRTGAPVFCDGKVGRDAIHVSLAAERSLRTGRVLRWDEEAEL